MTKQGQDRLRKAHKWFGHRLDGAGKDAPEWYDMEKESYGSTLMNVWNRPEVTNE